MPVRKPVSAMSNEDKARFFAMLVVNETTGCHEWIGTATKFGYGAFHVSADGRDTKNMQKAHRVAYMLHHGVDLPYGDRQHCVCHSCDNPRCCNPEHLWLGTYADNMRDMAKKGRRKHITEGEKHGRAILTEEAVKRIRSLVFAIPRRGGRQELKQKLADEYHVSFHTVSDALRGASWSHI